MLCRILLRSYSAKVDIALPVNDRLVTVSHQPLLYDVDHCFRASKYWKLDFCSTYQMLGATKVNEASVLSDML